MAKSEKARTTWTTLDRDGLPSNLLAAIDMLLSLRWLEERNNWR